jgi:hypothetical protein
MDVVPRFATLALAALTLAVVAPAADVVAQDTTTTPVSATATTAPRQATGEAPVATDNPFLPADENLSDCVSVLERPDCGSSSKGGWHQFYVFVALLLGLGFIGWRVVVTMRRAERTRHR